MQGLCTCVPMWESGFHRCGFLRTLLMTAGYMERFPISAFEQADKQDITLILAGNGDAYARIVRRYQDWVASVMRRFTRDKQQLEELVQDVFVEVYTSLGNFKQGCPFPPWLRKIAVRVGYAFWKKKARTHAEVSIEELGDVFFEEGKLEASQAAEILHELLAKLPPRDRLVLTLHYLDELSVREVAEATGWSRIMVKVQLYRARGKLKRLADEVMGREDQRT